MRARRAARVFRFVATLALAAFGAAPSVALAESLHRLAEGVFLFTKGSHRSLFIVTPGGVVLTDPQSPLAAKDYLQEIRRVTDQPVKYVIYSHRHSDHAAGGAVFLPDGAVFISHEVAQRRLMAERKPDVVVPTLAFRDRLTLILGGRRIEVLFLGKSETDDNVFVYLPKEKILFAVDSIGNRAVPWGYLEDAHPVEWIETLKRVESLDIQILALGHGDPGNKETVREFREYLEDLVRGVEGLMKKGLELDEIQAQFRLPKYREWRFYDVHFSMNVARVYEVLQERREKTK